MRYLLIILSLINITIFLSGCGEAPMGWEGALISDETTPNSDNDEEQDDEEQDDEEQDDEEQDDEIPPPPDTKLFFTNESYILENAIENCHPNLNCEDFIYTIESQSGFCYDPINETVSDASMLLHLVYEWGTTDEEIEFIVTNYTNNIASGTFNLVQAYSGTGGNLDFNFTGSFELTFNSDFSSANLYYVYDEIDEPYNFRNWVYNTNSTCE